MSQRTSQPGRPAPTATARSGRTRMPRDDRLSHQISDALRHAAEAREARDQRKSTDDARANERETAALRALIDRSLEAGTGNR